jgi:hypothetical protein
MNEREIGRGSVTLRFTRCVSLGAGAISLTQYFTVALIAFSGAISPGIDLTLP